jgi:hypothetical protein
LDKNKKPKKADYSKGARPSLAHEVQLVMSAARGCELVSSCSHAHERSKQDDMRKLGSPQPNRTGFSLVVGYGRSKMRVQVATHSHSPDDIDPVMAVIITAWNKAYPKNPYVEKESAVAAAAS